MYKQELENRYRAIRQRMFNPQGVPDALRAANRAVLQNRATMSTLPAPNAVGGVAASTGVVRPTALTQIGLTPLVTPRQSYINILKMVAKKHGLEPDMIIGVTRERSVIKARHEFWYRVHNELGYSFARIGRMENKDHTSISYGASKHAARMLDKKTLEAQFDQAS